MGGLGMCDISMSGVDAWQCPHAWIGNVVTSQSRHWEFGDIQVHALGRLRRLNADMADGGGIHSDPGCGRVWVEGHGPQHSLKESSHPCRGGHPFCAVRPNVVFI